MGEALGDTVKIEVGEYVGDTDGMELEDRIEMAVGIEVKEAVGDTVETAVSQISSLGITHQELPYTLIIKNAFINLFLTATIQNELRRSD